VNYSAHYDRLIYRARIRVLTGYRERHHVIPRCIGGGNEKENIVELTAEEHFLAHQLLSKMHPTSHGLAWAAVNMARRAHCNKAYGRLRRKLAKHISQLNRGNKYTFGSKRTAEQNARNSAARLGKPLSAEHRANISRAHRGKKMPPMSIEQRAKLSEALRGRLAWNKGKSLLKEQQCL
jgi:hypothetical protein